MTQLNMRNHTLGIMDNLPFLRSLNNECNDLISNDYTLSQLSSVSFCLAMMG